jgi:hypothetical protein
MLDACAPKWTKEETPHYFCIRWKGRTYPSLPRGPRGKKKGQRKGLALVWLGHVAHMIKQLEIDEACAKKHLDGLS